MIVEIIIQAVSVISEAELLTLNQFIISPDHHLEIIHCIIFSHGSKKPMLCINGMGLLIMTARTLTREIYHDKFHIGQ